MPETYSPILLRKRAAALSKLTGKVYKSNVDIQRGTTPAKQIFQTSMARPWVLLFREPIILFLSLYFAIIYGTLYLLFGAFPIVYQQGRGWGPGVGSLAFLGVLIGMLLAVSYSVFVDQPRYVRILQKAKGVVPPEVRLGGSMIGGIALPIGLFWFAWTNSPSLPWAASVAAGIPFGFGMLLVFLSIFNYLIDAYTIFAASALAANGILRSIFGAVFPLFTKYMFDGIGIHWASTIPAFLALICAPFPFIFWKYGADIRMKCKYSSEADIFMRRLRGEAPDEKRDDASEVLDEKEEYAASTSDGAKDEENAAFESIRAPTAARLTDGREKVDDRFEEANEAWAEANKHDQTSTPHAHKARTQEQQQHRKPEIYEHSPYDIDRVNTRHSFNSERRSRSRAGSSRGGSRSVSRTTSRQH